MSERARRPQAWLNIRFALSDSAAAPLPKLRTVAWFDCQRQAGQNFGKLTSRHHASVALGTAAFACMLSSKGQLTRTSQSKGMMQCLSSCMGIWLIDQLFDSITCVQYIADKQAQWCCSTRKHADAVNLFERILAGTWQVVNNVSFYLASTTSELAGWPLDVRRRTQTASLEATSGTVPISDQSTRSCHNETSRPALMLAVGKGFDQLRE